jgi:hypothetical protein
MPWVIRVERSDGTLLGYNCRKRLVKRQNATKYPSPSSARAALSQITAPDRVLSVQDWLTEDCPENRPPDEAPAIP